MSTWKGGEEAGSIWEAEGTFAEKGRAHEEAYGQKRMEQLKRLREPLPLLRESDQYEELEELRDWNKRLEMTNAQTLDCAEVDALQTVTPVKYLDAYIQKLKTDPLFHLKERHQARADYHM